MLATLQKLGIAPSFSRPGVSDDNAQVEAFFRTLKYRPGYPAKGFQTLEMARDWVQGMVHPARLGDAALIDAIVGMFARKSAEVFAAQIRADRRFELRVGLSEGETLLSINHRRAPLNQLPEQMCSNHSGTPCHQYHKRN